jgi:DnaJ-domain-containing protein 1
VEELRQRVERLEQRQGQGQRRGTRTENHSQANQSQSQSQNQTDPSGGPRPGGTPGTDPRLEALRLLGLEGGASPQAIKRAYWRLAKTHHPDLGGDAEAFRRIDAAYRLLMD